MTEGDIIEVEVGKGKQPATSALSFFLPDHVSAALNRSRFTVDEEIGMIVDVVRETDNVWARIAALRLLNSRIKESLVMSGAVKTLEARATLTGEDGQEMVLEAKSLKLLEGAVEDVVSVGDGQREKPNEDDGIECVPVEAIEDGADEDDEGAAYAGLGEIREGHFPPSTLRGGLSGGASSEGSPDHPG